MNPDVQLTLCKNPNVCHTGNYPTLHDLDVAYYDGESASWVVNMLVDIAEFCGCKEKMSERQYQQLATMIANDYSTYKISEFMLFCYRFKQGKYGRFYGHIDPMIILQALSQFNGELIDERNRIVEEEANEKAKSENNMYYEEWCKMTGREPKPLEIHLAEEKPKQKKEAKFTPEQILSYARNTISETVAGVREHMEAYFISKFKKKPSEYIKEYENAHGTK